MSAAASDGRRSRPQGARVPARARPSRLCRGDPARLQSRRAARQQVQGADQDPAAREDPRDAEVEIEAEFAARDRSLLDLPPEEVARVAAFFAPPALEPKKPVSDRVERRKSQGRALRELPRANVVAHRRRATASYRVAETDRRAAGRRQRRPARRRRRSRRGLFAGRDPRLARAEPDPAPCRARRPAGRSTTGLPRSGSPPRTPARSATSSPAPASTIARSRPPARFPSRSASPRRSATARDRRRSARSRSRSADASTPAATITSATSASSASSAPARRPTRSPSAARATRPPRSARSSVRASVRRTWSGRSRPIVETYMGLGATRPRRSSTPSAGSGSAPFKEALYERSAGSDI